MQRIDGKSMTLMVPREIVTLVKRISKRHDIKEAQALRALLLLGADHYQNMESIGIPQVANFIVNLKSKLKEERFFSEEKVIDDLFIKSDRQLSLF